MEMLEKLRTLGVRVSDNVLPFCERLVSQGPGRLTEYEGFFLLNEYPSQVTDYGTLEDCVAYATEHKDEGLSLCYWGR